MIRHSLPRRLEAVRCRSCGRSSPLIAKALRACADCIRQRPDAVLPDILALHGASREPFGLPAEAPQSPDGVRCRFCFRGCRIPEGGLGYCGLRTARGDRLVHLGGMPDAGVLEWYYDPLPTNCVAEWVCAEASPRPGTNNLAVFYGACGFNCLFCQNWTYKELARRRLPRISAAELSGRVQENTACICFFGGDPSPQLPHALAASELALEKAPVRICWETNGSMNPAYLRRAARLALESGGTVRFDLTAWDDSLHQALCGISNRRTLEDFRWLAEFGKQRRRPPLAVASTCLVPGYVDEQEVGQIARFVASSDPDIPYSLLAFRPQFLLNDLPTTSRKQADEYLRAARGAGLTNVRIGNTHLLSER